MKFNFLKSSSSSLIGVDISTSAIKMVELSVVGKRQYRLESYANVPLPQGAINDGNVNDLTIVSDTVRKAWKMLGTRSRQVVMALPTAAVISKRVMMPAGMGEEAMEAQVENEAIQHIPFPLEEMNLDFQVLGPPDNKKLDKKNEAADVEVLIVAAKKEKIDDRLATAEEADLKVLIMDVDAYATEMAYAHILRHLQEKTRHTTTMIIDIGAHITNTIVMIGSNAVYTREQPFGGALLTQEIQRRFGLTPEETEIAKRNGGLPDSYAAEVLQPFLDALVSEVARALTFFKNATAYGQVDHVLLAGGVASIAGVATLVEQKTGLHTLLANPFVGMTLSNKIKPTQLASDAPALMVACGLALRGAGA